MLMKAERQKTNIRELSFRSVSLLLRHATVQYNHVEVNLVRLEKADSVYVPDRHLLLYLTPILGEPRDYLLGLLKSHRDEHGRLLIFLDRTGTKTAFTFLPES